MSDETTQGPIPVHQRLANLFDRVLSVKGSMMVDHDAFHPAELASLIEHTCPTSMVPYVPTNSDGPLREWLGERLDIILNAIDRVADRTDSDDTMAIAEQKAISAEYDRGVAAGRASIQDAMVREQREIRENGFDDGVKIGASEREAELLEAGWTPPGAIVCPNGEVHELEVSTGPTDYEVWRDALMIAGSQRNRRQLETGTIRVDAEWFWEQLQDVPVLKNDDGTDTVHDRIDGDETSWGPMATIDPTNTPLNEPPA